MMAFWWSYVCVMAGFLVGFLVAAIMAAGREHIRDDVPRYRDIDLPPGCEPLPPPRDYAPPAPPMHYRR